MAVVRWQVTIHFKPDVERTLLSASTDQFNAYWKVVQQHIKQSFEDQVSWFVAQPEIGDKGRLHLQGAFHLKKKARRAAVLKQEVFTWKDWVPVHLEVCKGTPENNYDYCTDVEKRYKGALVDFFEIGKITHQGERNDLVHIAEMVKEGASDTTIAEQHPSDYIRYYRGISALRRTLPTEAVIERDIVLAFGPPGCGKSYKARFEGIGGDTTKYWDASDSSLKWFDGYDRQQRAILDDFDPRDGGARLDKFLRFTDKYNQNLEIKGGFTGHRAREIWITSNYHPRHWYDFAGKLGPQWRSLVRRFKTVYWFLRPDEYDNFTVIRPGDERWEYFWKGPPMGPGGVMGAVAPGLEERTEFQYWDF